MGSVLIAFEGEYGQSAKIAEFIPRGEASRSVISRSPAGTALSRISWS
jgi:hypothetical protein